MAVDWTMISQTQEVRDLVMENLLAARMFEPLHPATAFRETLVGMGERWTDKADSKAFSRRGLLPKNAQRRQPRIDFSPQAPPGLEQWIAYLGDYGDSIDVHLPDTLVQVISDLETNAAAIGSQAGRSIDALVRNLAYGAAMSGNTYATALGSSSTSLPVACCYGFHEAAAAGVSKLTAVSSGNPLAITVGGVAASVTGCTPTNSEPEGIFGPGVLTLAVAKSWAANAAVLSADRSVIQRSGGGTSIHSLTVADGLTVSMIEQAVAKMRQNDVPGFMVGGETMYLLFASPMSVASLRRDPEFREQNIGLGTDAKIFGYVGVEKIAGCLVIQTSSAANENSVDGTSAGAFSVQDPFPGGPPVTRNASDVRIERPIICGADMVMEHSTSATVISEAGLNGTMRAMSSISPQGNATVNVNGIDLIIRAPQDRRMSTIAMTWAFRAGYGIPTDRLTGDSQRYKRATVLEHAVAG